jgi:dipeptidase
MSYGELIFVTLQRAASAREAIAIFNNLTNTYGYESSGESFGIADAEEVWLLEMVSKGQFGFGSVWVASKVPEGYVGATSNQARTTTFNQSSPDVMFSSDLISFARSTGFFNGTDAEFNFREFADPITFSGCRFGEARVFNLFNPICNNCVESHLDFAQGRNLANSMPLFVPVSKKLNIDDVMQVMRTHFEGSWFDNRGVTRPDIGAGPGHSPYRFRPLVWTAPNGKNYLNERTVGTQQSGWAFVAASRGWLPEPIRAVSWFAPDDSATSPRIPTYGCMTRIPASFGSLVGYV